MELSEEIQSILQKYKGPKKQGEQGDVSVDDLIDLDAIDLSDDQTWLMTPSSTQNNSTATPDIPKWIQEEHKTPSNYMTMIKSKSSPRKNIDTRTFTRPKKKFNRPSIEKYNEDYFDGEKKSPLTEEIDNYISSFHEEDLYSSVSSMDKPLHFDLSQPTSANFFDKILSGAPDLDSFQNMSPPSLVNSMCSSTFTNLMENSYIKNDPILREIRDADYSQQIYQDAEPPLYQSITESCSSINSEVAENFVRKTLSNLNGTYQMNESVEETSVADNEETFVNSQGDTYIHSENIDPNIQLNTTFPPVNGTFRKSFIKDRLNSSLDKITNEEFLSDFERKSQRIRDGLSETYKELSRKEQEQLNNLESSGCENEEKEHSKTSYQKEQNNLSNTVKKVEYNNLNRTFEKRVSTGRNNVEVNETSVASDNRRSRRLSAEIDDFLNAKMNDVRLSADSSDSLDRMSSLSNCSRESRQISMAEVDAIVEQQERSLQVMSTPKPAKSLTRLFENTFISPIHAKEHLSDSEVSEEYVSARSGHSIDKVSLDRNVKSLNNLKQPIEVPKLRSINTMTSGLQGASRLKGSCGNLQVMGSRIRGSYGNLRAMGPQLKGSYTNLRPTNTNLPCIPPPRGFVDTRLTKTDVNVTRTLEEPKRFDATFKRPQVPKEPVKVQQQQSNLNSTFVKPQSKLSSLPRPVSAATGIPRPSSKIPAPKSVRSTSARQLVRPSSKLNVNDGFY